MSKKILFLLYFAFFPIIVSAINVETKQELIEGTDSDEYLNVTNTSDGGFIAVGDSRSPEITNLDSNNRRAIIVKYKDDNQQWLQTYGVEDNALFSHVKELNDNSIIVTGFYNFNQAAIVRYEANGNKIHEKISNQYECEYGEIFPTEDGGYIIHETRGAFEAKYESLLVKYDKNNNKEWEKQVDIGTFINKIKQYKGTFYALYRDTSGIHNIVKISLEGDILEKISLDSTIRSITDFEITEDENLYLVGHDYRDYYKYYSIFEYIDRTNHNNSWKKEISSDEGVLISSVIKLKNGGILVVGTTNAKEILGMVEDNTSSKTFLINYDTKGNIKWKNLYNETIYTGVIVGNNNNYILSGRSNIIKKEGNKTGIITDAKILDSTYEYEYVIENSPNGKINIEQNGEVGEIEVLTDKNYVLDKISIEGIDGKNYNSYKENDKYLFEFNDKIKISVTFKKQEAPNPNTSAMSIIVFILGGIIALMITKKYSNKLKWINK